MTQVMRKTGLALATALVLAGMFAAVAFAGSAFSNAKAEFEPGPASTAPDGDGEAIINYVKGRQAWNVSGSVTDLQPNNEYRVEVRETGTGIPTVVATFETDDDGNGNVSENHADGLPDEYDEIHVVDQVTGLSDLEAHEDGSVGELRFRGTGRGQ